MGVPLAETTVPLTVPFCAAAMFANIKKRKAHPENAPLTILFIWVNPTSYKLGINASFTPPLQAGEETTWNSEARIKGGKALLKSKEMALLGLFLLVFIACGIGCARREHASGNFTHVFYKVVRK